MDQINVICRDMRDGFRLLSAIAGHHPNDGVMFPEIKYEYEATDRKITLGVPRDVLELCDDKTRRNIESFIGNYNAADIRLEYFKVYRQVFLILSCAEISANLQRCDGIRYGFRAEGGGVGELYSRTRTEGFGTGAKLASVLGAAMLSGDYYAEYYLKAMKIRRLIKDSVTFAGYDAVILPVSSGGTDSLSLSALPSLAGLPSVAFRYNGTGIRLVADVKGENTLLTAWEVVDP
jgi:aspartyl-tRNA(Asn)/glutamyl-tRNA(Gln) amidotransferase subunit A